MTMLADLREKVGASGDRHMRVRALTSATHAAIASQQYAKCLELASEARDLLKRIGDRDAESDVVMHEASALARMSRFDLARARYEEAAALYSTIGRRQGLAAVLVNGGIVSVHLGLLAEAEATMRRAHELFASLGNVRGQA